MVLFESRYRSSDVVFVLGRFGRSIAMTMQAGTRGAIVEEGQLRVTRPAILNLHILLERFSLLVLQFPG